MTDVNLILNIVLFVFFQDKNYNDDLHVEGSYSFMHVYNTLPTRLPSKLAENLSAPLAIVALLHLANEKTLHLVGNEDLSDLIITQG
jgi:condensin complex subunit 2